MKYVGKLFGQIGRTRGYFDLGKTSEDWDALETRAERAEASLHALRLVCGTTDADKFSTWVDRANAKAEKAEAELANIRALANRRNKGDHSQDTTHQLVAALDQALDIAQAELSAERDKVKTLRSATDLLMARANDELKSGRPALIAMQWHRIEPIIAALAAMEETK